MGARTARAGSSGRPVRVVEGGNSRQQSVENALASLEPDTDLVAVHDAVRPFVDLETIEQVIREAAETGAAIVGIVPVDTVKQVHAQHKHVRVRHPSARAAWCWRRRRRCSATTCSSSAFEKAREDGFIGTDESSLVERLEQSKSAWCPGSDRNIKITKPGDMDLARLFLDQEMAERKLA